MKGLGILFYIVGSIFGIIGSHKLWAYKSVDSIFYKPVNAYVGGDAYNYIINAGKATAYFNLALIFIILGSTTFILNKLSPPANNAKRVEDTPLNTIQEEIIEPITQPIVSNNEDCIKEPI